jgi:hypothetical protein
MAVVTLNGTSFYPSDIQVEFTKVGVSLVADNGSRRFVHRLSGATPINKLNWVLSWERVTETVRGQIGVIANLSTTFTYVDQHAVSYTVQTEESAFTSSIAFVAAGAVLYYNVELRIWQV